MQEETKQRWLDLCAEAAITEDPDRLEQLLQSLKAIVREEQERLRAALLRRRV